MPDVSEGPRGPVVITLPATRCIPPVVERLKEVLASHPGITEVHLQLTSAGRTTVLRLDDRLRVARAGPDGRPQGAAGTRLRLRLSSARPDLPGWAPGGGADARRWWGEPRYGV